MSIGEGSREALTTADIALIDTINSPSRKAEQTAWRTALRALIGSDEEVVYLLSGAPALTGRGQHISVTHNTKWAAVAISRERCGIDIEHLTRNFDRVASRYISPEEGELSESNHPLFKPLLWSAKEAIYKFVATENIDFIKDIRVVATDIPANKLWAEFRNTPLPEMQFTIIDNNSLLCIICDK